MKYFYFAVTIEENEKYYAYMLKLSSFDNVLSKLKIKGILHANIFNTKKEAAATVEAWNKSYKANGTYLFENSPFKEVI